MQITGKVSLNKAADKSKRIWVFAVMAILGQYTMTGCLTKSLIEYTKPADWNISKFEEYEETMDDLKVENLKMVRAENDKKEKIWKFIFDAAYIDRGELKKRLFDSFRLQYEEEDVLAYKVYDEKKLKIDYSIPVNPAINKKGAIVICTEWMFGCSEIKSFEQIDPGDLIIHKSQLLKIRTNPVAYTVLPSRTNCGDIDNYLPWNITGVFSSPRYDGLSKTLFDEKKQVLYFEFFERSFRLPPPAVHVFQCNAKSRQWESVERSKDANLSSYLGIPFFHLVNREIRMNSHIIKPDYGLILYKKPLFAILIVPALAADALTVPFGAVFAFWYISFRSP